MGALPEGAVFTPDGHHLLVGNYLDQEFSILRVNGTEIIDTGKRFKSAWSPGLGQQRQHDLDMRRMPKPCARQNGPRR